jgi:predicted ester cyclase
MVFSMLEIDRDAWLSMSARLKTAFPDLDYHFKVIGTEGNVIRTTSQWTGTHSGSLDLTDRNMDGCDPCHKQELCRKP